MEPFLVIRKINDNAYVLDMPQEYGDSCTFNISDLSHFDVGRTTVRGAKDHEEKNMSRRASQRERQERRYEEEPYIERKGIRYEETPHRD
ncbi:hypothetical protein CR513_28616, partial [Mucuna pruriens]